ncbi:MAG: hypothetical protein M3552_02175 [Planctomycetota bacterium]|nr:hypothetical protein [Planctomycetaceae bacterium]MDQ3329454.1 hypothetical protein [Planctomycetota bacterium]
MSALGSLPAMTTGLASSAAGSVSNGAADRAAKLDAANHSLAAGQKALASHPLDRDASTSADRDADGWTGGGTDETEPSQTPTRGSSATPDMPALTRPRLPDDPCGGSLDVIV